MSIARDVGELATAGRPDEASIEDLIWRMKYRAGWPGSAPDGSIEATFERAARVACIREAAPELWCRRFLDAFASHRLLPGGRILANAGRGCLPLLNTYVIPPVSERPERILDCLGLSGSTLKAGGGIGLDFSDVPPCADGSGVGPVAMMDLWNSLAHSAFGKTDRRGARACQIFRVI